ncbi:MAG: sugar transferase, partial [Oscillospiraceae bacterium]|nr:sugar transferase [Oscillospiraceae bacterium]
YGKYNTTFAEKARLDMYYIQHASLLWDLQLMFYTLKIIFIRESTEGVDRPAEASDAPAEPQAAEENAPDAAD